jgi:hypothetical protein
MKKNKHFPFFVHMPASLFYVIASQFAFLSFLKEFFVFLFLAENRSIYQ